MTISSKLFATQMLDQFKFIENRLQNLNTQIATGTRLTQSSDAPLDAAAQRALEDDDGLPPCGGVVGTVSPVMYCPKESRTRSQRYCGSGCQRSSMCSSEM